MEGGVCKNGTSAAVGKLENTRNRRGEIAGEEEDCDPRYP